MSEKRKIWIRFGRARALLCVLSTCGLCLSQTCVATCADEEVQQVLAGTQEPKDSAADSTADVIPPTAPTRIRRPNQGDMTPGSYSEAPPPAPSIAPQRAAAGADGNGTAGANAASDNKKATTADKTSATRANNNASAKKPDQSSTAKSGDVHLSAEQPKLAPLKPKTDNTPATTANAPARQSDTTGGSTKAEANPGQEGYPTIGKMEQLTFGAATPNADIGERLNKLELAVLKKTYTTDSLFDRTERLKNLLLGGGEDDTAMDPDRMIASAGPDTLPLGAGSQTGNSGGPMAEYFEELSLAPENQSEITREEAQQFFLQLINDERQKNALGPLVLDTKAMKLAGDQVADICRRNVLSHSNSKGENPDRRYTLAGGDGAVTESLVSLKRAELGSNKHTRAAVCKMLKILVSRQDDREALFAAEASDLGVGIDWNTAKDKLLACIEIVSKHGFIDPLPADIHVGDKVEVKGVIAQPFKFEKITIAWEGNHNGSTSSDESEEALPYFPPLDYVAYQKKSEHDYSGTLTALRTIGIVAAIAGGVFMPPVALAAPLIAMSGSMGSGDPKPVSDIPVHGGVHVDNGSTFSAHVPLNNSGKDGIYYITVWASLGSGTRAVPISRRALVAGSVDETVQAKVEENSNDKDP